MRGMEFTVVLTLIIAFIVIFISLEALASTGTFKGKLFVNPINIELISKYPDISAVSPAGCSGTVCNYDLQIKGISFKSTTPEYVLVDVKYKGQHKLFPCPAAENRQSDGSCLVTEDGIGFDLNPVFEGSIYTMPPTLNLSNTNEYTTDMGAVISGQTIIIGNFSVTFDYMSIPLMKDRARYLVMCADDAHLLVHSEGDSDRLTMCNGEIRVSTADIDTSGILLRGNDRKGCANIYAKGGKEWEYTDNVNIEIWNASLLDCANISFASPIQTAQPIELADEKVIACFRHVVTNWDFEVPVAPWDPSQWQQPAGFCSV